MSFTGMEYSAHFVRKMNSVNRYHKYIIQFSSYYLVELLPLRTPGAIMGPECGTGPGAHRRKRGGPQISPGGVSIAERNRPE
jgi:hypothetical protein